MTPGQRALLDAARTLFECEFGSDSGEPDGAWWAPGRVNIIGEHTDYNGGFVLPIALPTGTVAVARRRDDDLVRLVSEGNRVEVRLGEISRDADLGWAAYAAGVAWAAMDDGVGRNGSNDQRGGSENSHPHRGRDGHCNRDIPGIDIAFAADVPRGAGLSSSASLSCSTAAAWNDLAGWGLDGAAIAKLGRIAENEIAGAPTGTMDQLASVLCEAGHALRLDTLHTTTTQVPFDLDHANLVLLVVDSHAPHQLVDGAYGERRRSCEEAADLLGIERGHLCDEIDGRDIDAVDARLSHLPDVPRRRARHVITDSARVLAVTDLLDGGVTREKAKRVGELMTASHASMRDDFEITVPAVDTLASALLDGGAFGARMTGGGFGGCVIALVDADRVGDCVAAAETAAAAAGFARPEPFVALASDGAHRLV